MDQLFQEQPFRIGKTDIEVTPMGVGTWSWGETGWGYGGNYSDSDIEDAYRVSVENGLNFFDTAEVYGGGTSELFLGRFLHNEKRKIIVATKYAPKRSRLLAFTMTSVLKQSLKRLGRDSVDLYQIHWYNRMTPLPMLMKRLSATVHDGLAKAVGVSNFSREMMCRSQDELAKQGIPLASNQIEYHLLHRNPERDGTLDECRKRGISLIAYSPLAMGILSGKYTAENPPQGFRGQKYNPDYLRKFTPLLKLLEDIGKSHNKTMAQVAINWVLSKGCLPIPNAKNGKQAKENLGALGWRLTESEVVLLDKASDGVQL